MFRNLRHLLTIALLCAPLAARSAPAAMLPALDFARHPTLSHPSISPDGTLLAVSVLNNDKGENSHYQLAVLHLPDLKVLSRLDLPRRNVPGQVVWVSNTRLVMALAYESIWLKVPQLTGDAVAMDYDGRHQEWMDIGWNGIVGTPNPRNGHFYITHYDNGARPDSEILDMDSSREYGHWKVIGKIDKANMDFLVHDGVARYAYGSPGPDSDKIVTYTRDSNDQTWRQLPDSITHGNLTPLAIGADGHELWSLYSANGDPSVLVVSKPDGSDRKVLAGSNFSEIGRIEWAPHDGAPYAVTMATGRPHFTYLDDSALARVQKALSEKFPDHVIDVSGYSDDGMELLIYAYSDRDPGTFALFDRRSMHLRPLFQLQPWIKSAQMAERRPIRFKAGDGVALDGYLTIPADGARTHPLVLLPHGGPIGIADDWGYDADAQFLANRGYLVLQVNYRGSSGRGDAFMRSGYKHFGDRIQQDLIDGVQWTIDQGYADPKRICVYGGSFGGYSALMEPILAPHLFKCAIDYAGVSDWTIVMKHDTRDSKAASVFFADAIGDKDAARAISPLYQLDKFNVPVLIAHGKDDERVPYRNATALRRALDRAGKPYVWLSKAREGHGFYSEKDRTELLQQMQDFLGKYLGG